MRRKCAILFSNDLPLEGLTFQKQIGAVTEKALVPMLVCGLSTTKKSELESSSDFFVVPRLQTNIGTKTFSVDAQQEYSSDFFDHRICRNEIKFVNELSDEY